MNKFVKLPVNKKWYELGIQLLSGVENSVDKLDIIRDNYPRDVETCCTEMFKLWLKETDASWSKLVTTLEVIGLNTLAKQLKEVCGYNIIT